MSAEILHESFGVELTARFGESLSEPLSFLEHFVGD